MYTRTYFTENDKLSIPENYDGNAFRERISDGSTEIKITDEENNEYSEESSEKYEKTSGGASSFFERLPIKNLISKFPIKGLFKGNSNLFERFGYEEILISALMLYMFFSKEGDKECAVMLLLLLFVS